MEFPMSGVNKGELLNRVIAWEKKGYEVCFPIQEEKKYFKEFKQDRDNYRKSIYSGVLFETTYRVKMRKVV